MSHRGSADSYAMASDDASMDAVEATATVRDVGVVVVPEPPTVALAPFGPFVKWLLSSPIEEVASIHKTLPFEITEPFTQLKLATPTCKPAIDFACRAAAAFARAEIEADWENVADELSVATREREGIEEKVYDLEHEREGSREKISLLESRIVKHLQDRDLAIAEKYSTEKQIEEIEVWKAQHAEKRQSMLLGFLRKQPEKRSSSVATHQSNKEIERLQKEIADTKMETALAKAELDTHYYRLRQLEKKCVGLKLEIAQASALEDDLQASLVQLRRERRLSLDRLQQVSEFSIAAKKQLSPKAALSPRKGGSFSPRRMTMKS